MVYLLSAFTTFTTLSWRQQAPSYRPLPSHVTRKLIPSPGGDLEVLISFPKSNSSSSTSAPAIFFLHGGCGSAGVWLEWMSYLHVAGYPGTLYAFSARNHGASYTLPFWRMVWFTDFTDIQADAKTCLAYANALEKERDATARPAIMVGHSAGGGLAQAILASGAVQTSGLALVGAIPSFGSLDMYWNWLKHDPWFPFRSSLHLQHPTSPLSTDELVHGAFFSRQFPVSKVQEFRKWMAGFEAMGWALDMIGTDILEWFAGKGNRWLDCGDVVRNIARDGNTGQEVCLLIGREDMMYRACMWEKQVAEYRLAIEKKRGTSEERKESRQEESIEKVTVQSDGGVRLILVADSGHHVQNDLYADQAAEALLRWIKQV